MSPPPSIPLDAHQVTPDIHVLSAAMPIPMFGMYHFNAYLVKGAQPYLVDTGIAPERERFVSELSKLINLEDLRWIFITHDDPDHVGALNAVLDKAPNAKVVTNFVGMGRMGIHAPVPPPRVHWLNPGETIDLGDRKISGFRTPVTDNPSEVGYYDPKLKAMFSADLFGAPLPKAATNAADFAATQLAEGQTAWGALAYPYAHSLDRSLHTKRVNDVRAIKPEWILSAHLPPAKGTIDAYCDTLIKLPEAKPWVGPSHSVLEEMLKAHAPH